MRGDGRVFQRGQTFWIAYYKKTAGRSVEVREPGGKTEKEALKKLRHRRKEIGAEALGVYIFAGPEADRLTIDDLLNSLEEHYRIGHRQSNKAANGTIDRELHILQRAFSLAVEHKRLTPVHLPEFPTLSEDNVREGFVEKGDFDSILCHLKSTDVRDFVAWGFWTGMRRGEIAKLTWAAFDRESSTLILPGRSTKGKKPRKLILEGVYREIIARRLSVRRLDCPYIFHRQGQAMGSFRKAWANASRKAGVSGLIFHDLRRTAVRNMIRAGVDKTVAKRISGHRTDAVFDRYNITSDEDLQDAQQRLEQYVATLPARSSVAPFGQVVRELTQNTDKTRTISDYPQEGACATS
jgi:integrase